MAELGVVASDVSDDGVDCLGSVDAASVEEASAPVVVEDAVAVVMAFDEPEAPVSPEALLLPPPQPTSPKLKKAALKITLKRDVLIEEGHGIDCRVDSTRNISISPDGYFLIFRTTPGWRSPSEF